MAYYCKPDPVANFRWIGYWSPMGADRYQKFYRPEIDGLRAVAVVGVILFHAGVPGLPGGYTGVDVFFVISGYLITQILLRDISTGNFSYCHFYERRIRRILPALFAMLAVVTAMSLIFLPFDMKQFGKSLAAVPLFLSNFLFWYSSGYFSSDVDTLPLLHTWSLAIEEQFYIFFPICLTLLARHFPRAIALAVICLAFTSFAICFEETLRDARSGFYLPYARAWELMLGAFLATGAVKTSSSSATREALSFGGLAMIIGAMVLFTKSIPFPGYAALLPCAGAAFLLYGTQTGGTLAGRLLSSRVPVTIGRASYSLYLWHWPMIVFANYYVIDRAAPPYVKVAAAALSLPVGFLSWRFIEQPFRGPRALLTTRKLFAASVIASIAFFIMGLVGWATNGLPGRFPAFVSEITQKRFNANADCDAVRHCVIGTQGARPSFAVLGDSHAHALNNGLDELAKRQRVSGYAIYNLGCRPFLTEIVSETCRDKNREALRVLRGQHLREIFITAEWSTGTTARTTAELQEALHRTVKAASRDGAEVYVMLDVPAAPLSVPEALAKSRLLGLPESSLHPAVRVYIQNNAMFAAAARELERRGELHVLDPLPLFCGKSDCAIAQGNAPLYMDAAHLNSVGAAKAAALFANILKTDR